MSRVHTPRATGGSIGIGEHLESILAGSAAVGEATIVLGFIDRSRKSSRRGCRNAVVSDASCKGNARRWTLEGRRRDAANVMPMVEALKRTYRARARAGDAPISRR